jgi:hypothetical protein
VRRVPGEEQRRLSGRVPATDDRDRIPGAQTRFDLGRGVVDADTFKPTKPLDVRLAVLRAGSDEYGTGADLAAVIEGNGVIAVVIGESDRGGRNTHERTEFRGLDRRSLGEFRTRQSGRKTEIIFDQRRAPGLTAGGDRLDGDRVQALRRAVDGGGESGRTGTDDEQIANIVRVEWWRQPDESGQMCVGPAGSGRRVGCRGPRVDVAARPERR